MSSKKSIAIIGGGPGGLMTAHLLAQRGGGRCAATIFEAGPRLGGKVLTRRFDSAAASYEAGAAELYDYSHLGPDPLKELIAELGLSTSPMAGPTVVLDGKFLSDDDDIRRECGAGTLKALNDFSRKARAACSPSEYYESDWKADNEDPHSRQSFAKFLDTVNDETARRYIEIAVHSDVATEPHCTSATYGLQNWLMNDPRYLRLYTIDGGIERLPIELSKRTNARILLHRPVSRVSRTVHGKYAVISARDGEEVAEEFDFVIAALPNNWLPRIRWEGHDLAAAMRAHHQHYNHPAHYLRVSVLFDRPFWRDLVSGSFFMLDAFGGCCVYDESARDPNTKQGVLGWLIAGDAATTMANFSDEQLAAAVVNSLPVALHNRGQVLEAKVHRWLGSVNGLPMGYPVRDPDSRHLPEPVNHPGLFVVGDYLFDSTLNGLLDSADTAVECLLEELTEPATMPVPVIIPAAANLHTLPAIA